MPRANRIFLPEFVWHITHRCHDREFLLKARRDRRLWLKWLFEARRRYELSVLDYIVTRNHVHLLVRDRGRGETARAMQLVAGRTGQIGNMRKARLGAFWQGRYHATAVATDDHLLRCIGYIDLNMVRAGAVAHPAQWPESGYTEIQRLPRRYRIIDVPALQSLLGFEDVVQMQKTLAERASEDASSPTLPRVPQWTESVAVGDEVFLARFASSLGAPALALSVETHGSLTCLRDERAPYTTGITTFSAL